MDNEEGHNVKIIWKPTWNYRNESRPQVYERHCKWHWGSYQLTIPKLKKDVNGKVIELEEKLLLLEIHDRKNNLLFYGVEKEKDENVETVLQNMWESNYEVTAEQLKLATMIDCHRLP